MTDYHRPVRAEERELRLIRGTLFVAIGLRLVAPCAALVWLCAPELIHASGRLTSYTSLQTPAYNTVF